MPIITSPDPVYPPSTTNPLATPTPQRTTRLNTRGTILPGIQLTMSTLQQLYPPRLFPADGTIDMQRTPTLNPLGWVRGGTSPSGAALGTDVNATYWIGTAEKFLLQGAPQRIVWEPPAPGEEYLVPLTIVGPYKDPSIEVLPDLLVPLSPSTPGHYRQMGVFAAAQWAVRVIPMKVHIWANDYDDCDELVHWFASAVQMSFNGNIPNNDVWTPLGYQPDDKGSRGVQYQCIVRFAAPLHYAYFREVEATAASLTVTGQAPNVVVE